MGCVPGKRVSVYVETVNSYSITNEIQDFEELPISQSNNLSIIPINTTFTSTDSDEERLIQSFIATFNDWKKEHLCEKIKVNDVFMICVGAFIQTNKVFDKFNVITLNKNQSLITFNKITKQFVIVNINNHNKHPICDYISNNRNKYVCFNPYIYENLVEMANSFAQFMNVSDGVYSVE